MGFIVKDKFAEKKRKMKKNITNWSNSVSGWIAEGFAKQIFNYVILIIEFF
jgi:hypothetical protein